MSKAKKNTRAGHKQHLTVIERRLIKTKAWSALSTAAQSLYIAIRMEWKGERFNNNGAIALSVRQAASLMGVTKDTASKAFHDLQEKGFIVLHKSAVLGQHGQGRTAEYELTELPMPGLTSGRRLFSQWDENTNFPVHKSMKNNPTGRQTKHRSRHKKPDQSVIEMSTYKKSLS